MNLNYHNPPIYSIEDELNINSPRGGSHGGIVLQPSSAPTSPQHRHASLTSPPPLSPQISTSVSAITTSSDPNFHATNLRERNAAMLNNELMADVHFIVGPPQGIF